MMMNEHWFFSLGHESAACRVSIFRLSVTVKRRVLSATIYNIWATIMDGSMWANNQKEEGVGGVEALGMVNMFSVLHHSPIQGGLTKILAHY